MFLMTVIIEAAMNFKRKKGKAVATHGGRSHRYLKRKFKDDWRWMCNWPRWWDVVFHRRPARRRCKAQMAALRHGADPDGIAWELGGHKPHQYYW